MADGRFAGDPARMDDAYTERLGPFTFGLIYRKVAGDEGYTIHVMGPVDSSQEEVLRFDCFEKQPHYHLGVTNRDGPIVPIDAPRPLDWAIEEIRGSFGQFLEDAGADAVFDSSWSEDLGQMLDRLKEQAASSPRT